MDVCKTIGEYAKNLQKAARRLQRNPSDENALAAEESSREALGAFLSRYTLSEQDPKEERALLKAMGKVKAAFVHVTRGDEIVEHARRVFATFQRRHKRGIAKQGHWFAVCLPPDCKVTYQSVSRQWVKQRFPRNGSVGALYRVTPTQNGWHTKRVATLCRECNLKKAPA